MKQKALQSRRNFLASLGGLGLLGFFPSISLAQSYELLNESDDIIKAGPYLQVSFPDKIIVRWITNQLCYSWVEYGEAADNLNIKAHTVHSGLVEANNTINGVSLNDLEPGKIYYYRICSRVIRDFIPNKIVYGNTAGSKIYAFKAPSLNTDRVEFIVFNDIHDQPGSFDALLSNRDKDENDFVFLNGDIFNFIVDEDQLIKNLITPLGNLFAANTPFILSRGNHECRGKFARQLHKYFDEGKGRHYYSFQLGPLYAIVLDCGEDKADSVVVYGGIVDFDAYRLEQAKWLEQEIQKKEFKKSKYKIVFNHIPLFYSGNGHGTLHSRECWGDLLNKAKIDLLISGHTHKYGVHPAVEGEHDYPIVIGGGKAEGSRTIIKVVVKKDELDVNVIDDKGNIVGSLNI